MEDIQDIVIVGAGISGLATSLGLHRLGIRSLVLETSDSLRTTGFALGMWTNAWRALDALGVGDMLRAKHVRLNGIVTTSVEAGITTLELPFSSIDSKCDHDVRCVNRRVLLETLESELPEGTIRYSSKVVNIDNAGYLKSVHLADGTVLKTKVLIGCDGINSVVAKFLGLSKACLTGRVGVRGLVHYKGGHGFEPKFMLFFGKGIRYGVIPCDDHTIYWFFAFSPSAQEKGVEEDPTMIKQFILSKLGRVSDKIKRVFEDAELNCIVCSPLRFRKPWELLWGNISKENICVAGDALHPMTPDLGQGGCLALEDSVILARLLAEALKGKSSENNEGDEQWRIRKGMEKFSKERKWRSFEVISTAYMAGLTQHYDSAVVNLLRDKMTKFFAGVLLGKARYDCGNLAVS